MKKHIVIVLTMISAVFSAGCADALFVRSGSGEKLPVEIVQDASTGETVYVLTAEDGTLTRVDAGQVESRKEFSPAAEETVESALNVGKSQGGIIGAISSGLLLVWGFYKSRKVKAERQTLSSVVSGVSDVITAARDAVKSGETLTEEHIKKLLKAAQEDAGTRAAVVKLLNEQLGTKAA